MVDVYGMILNYTASNKIDYDILYISNYVYFKIYMYIIRPVIIRCKCKRWLVSMEYQGRGINAQLAGQSIRNKKKKNTTDLQKTDGIMYI